MDPLLEVRGLTVELPTAAGWVRPVHELSLEIEPGESLGLVGESGSGKTMLALALMGLLPARARVSGEAWIGTGDAGAGKDAANRSGKPERKQLLRQTEREWQKSRGAEIAMVFQEPMSSLNPVMRIGAQIEEAISAHRAGLNRAGRQALVIEFLRRVAVPEPETRARQFPHQLSGGLRQRAMIAMALAAGPKLLIADEPTTALDVTVQKQILELLGDLRRDLRLGLLLITHDLGVVAQVADRVAVIYAGRIIEQGPALDLLRAPRHPYTKGLVDSSPSLKPGALRPIPGSVPLLQALPPGCAFEPRCSLRRPECRAGVPALRLIAGEHSVRCILV